MSDSFWSDTADFQDSLLGDGATPQPTPAPESIGATPLPKELIPVNARTLPLFPQQQQGVGQWGPVGFDSEYIGKVPSAAALLELQEQQRLKEENEEFEFDGPTPTGKGMKDLANTFGLPPSLGVMFEEMQDAILGVIGDLTGSNTERESLGDILTHENRLRGIGTLLVLVAVVGLAIDSFAETEQASASLVSQVLDTIKK